MMHQLIQMSGRFLVKTSKENNVPLQRHSFLNKGLQMDSITYQIVVEILREEEEHKGGLEAIVQDLKNLTK